MATVQERWDLWNLQTLFPGWSAAERRVLLERGEVLDKRQRDLFAVPEKALARFGPEACAILRTHPALQRGLTISLHLGPYSLAPVPWLAAGLDVHVLVNRSSLAGIRPVYEALHGRLGLPGRVRWIPIEGRGFALRMMRALRRDEPVFAFLDGNDGLAGCEGTLREGLPYALPGRTIRVRTGLARLALRLGCPVHSLVTVWDETGGFGWRCGPAWTWPAGTSAEKATRDLFDWAFAVIRRHPEQWRAWNMLTGVVEGFRAEAPPPSDAMDLARAIADPAQAGRRLTWRRSGRIWPGDMLEDPAGHCFYAAAGLRQEQLDLLQDRGTFTPAELRIWLGGHWVREQLPRLAALGFVTPADSGANPG